MSTPLTIALALAGLSATTAAATTTAVVGSGDCRDPELAMAVRSLSSALANQHKVRLLDEASALSRIGRASSRGVEEIQRQLDNAQQQFYQAQYHKALAQIEAAQAEVERLPPGQVRWQLSVSARIMEGLIRTRLRRDGGPEEAFRRVLRLDPTHQLDSDFYGPSTLSLFNQIRQELQKAKRIRLTVKSTPAGADVFLDGRRVGATPYSADHHLGTYQLVVGKGDAFSLAREVDLGAQLEFHIDLRFEGAVHANRIPCISQPPDERTRLGHAVKLGSILDVDQLVVLRFEREKLGPSWLSATLVGIHGGEKVRDGGLQVGSTGLPTTGMAELARFVATGEATANVRASLPSARDDLRLSPADAPGPIAVLAHVPAGFGTAPNPPNSASSERGATTPSLHPSTSGKGATSPAPLGAAPAKGGTAPNVPTSAPGTHAPLGAAPAKAGTAPNVPTSAPGTHAPLGAAPAKAGTVPEATSPAFGTAATASAGNSTTNFGATSAPDTSIDAASGGAPIAPSTAGETTTPIDAVLSATSHPPPRGGVWRGAGYGLLGTGGVALVSGAVFSLIARDAQGDADRLSEGGLDEADAPAARAALDRAARYRPLGWGSLGMGALFTGGGAALLLLAPPARDSSPTLSVSPTAGGARVLVHGRF